MAYAGIHPLFSSEEEKDINCDFYVMSIAFA